MLALRNVGLFYQATIQINLYLQYIVVPFFVEYPFNFLFLIILLQTFAFVDFGCYNVLDFQELVQIFKPINSVGTHSSPIRSIRVKVHALMLL